VELAAPPALLRHHRTFVVLTLPQLIIDSLQLKIRVNWHGREQLMYGIVSMWPYWLGFLRLPLPGGARPATKAPLQLYIAADDVRAGGAGQGLAGPGLPVIIFSPTCCSPGAGSGCGGPSSPGRC
jgi:hypothetical protein